MKTLRYLAYGSNLHPRRLQRRVASAHLLGTIALSGWQLNFHKRGQDHSAKCNIIQTGKTADVVYGAIYEMLRQEKTQLDEIEGLHAGYRLAHIETVHSGPAFFYVADEAYIDDTLLPFDWYKTLVLAGGRYHDFPATYLAQIERVGSVADADKLRQQRNLSILDTQKTSGNSAV